MADPGKTAGGSAGKPKAGPRKPRPRRDAPSAAADEGRADTGATLGGPPSDGAAKGGGDRVAKVLSRAGVASRRDAERMIEAGRVAVNGRKLETPAVVIAPCDIVTVDDVPIEEAEPPRLFRYHKPKGVVTTARDEQGRETIYDTLPVGLPRLMPVGRLDIASEGLLLLTNDGELKRKLEMPSTAWLRKYRVRVHGAPTPAQIAPLQKGVVVDGERFQPMLVTIDRQQGANAWLTVGLREGRNREVRRAMEAVGLSVNRLIRTAYGPFRLGELAAGHVEEAPTKVLKEQLGLDLESPAARERRDRRVKGAEDDAAGAAGRAPRAKAETEAAPRTSRRGASRRLARAAAEAPSSEPGRAARPRRTPGEDREPGGPTRPDPGGRAKSGPSRPKRGPRP